MRKALSLPALCIIILHSNFLTGQEIDGYALGMSKDAVCKILTVRFPNSDPATACPRIDDFVTVPATAAIGPLGNSINLIFRDNRLLVAYSTFPVAHFQEALTLLEKQYHNPDQTWLIEAGQTSLLSGPYAANKDPMKSIAKFGLSRMTLPGMGVAEYSNVYFYWHRKVHVVLELNNRESNGEMMSWFALLSEEAPILGQQ